MRLTLVGAHHPPHRFSEMRRLDVVLDVPLRALLTEASVTGSVVAEGLARETPCRGTLERRGASVSLVLAFAADDGEERTITARSGGEASVRSLTEFRGELRPRDDPAAARTVILRLDVLVGAGLGSTTSRHKTS